MTASVNRVIEEIQTLSSTEKGFVAQCIISSLDDEHDENSSKEWAETAKKRYDELIAGKVESKDWNTIKKEVLGS